MNIVNPSNLSYQMTMTERKQACHILEACFTTPFNLISLTHLLFSLIMKDCVEAIIEQERGSF